MLKPRPWEVQGRGGVCDRLIRIRNHATELDGSLVIEKKSYPGRSSPAEDAMSRYLNHVR